MAERSMTRSSFGRMHERCERPSNDNYPWYGGKGISVCERWSGRRGFANFLEDMGPRPEGTSIDRKDGALGYFKDNCRWSTRKVQSRNRSSTVMVTVGGETMCCADWGARNGISKVTICMRLKAGWDPVRAVSERSRDFGRPTRSPRATRRNPQPGPS